jgi:hypothetical protein
LLAAALGMSAAQLLSSPEKQLAEEQVEVFARYVARRGGREPVSRILGKRDFYGRTFAVSPATLDPRPDSETLVEVALGLVDRAGLRAAPLRILDVGTGSGCLLATLLASCPARRGSALTSAKMPCRPHRQRTGSRRRAARSMDHRRRLENIDGPLTCWSAILPTFAHPKLRCSSRRFAISNPEARWTAAAMGWPSTAAWRHACRSWSRAGGQFSRSATIKLKLWQICWHPQPETGIRHA